MGLIFKRQITVNTILFLLTMFLLTTGLPVVHAAPPAPPEGKQWVHVWNDEFNGNTLDTTKWGSRGENYRRIRIHDGHIITWRYEDDNVSVRDGNLVLTNTRKQVNANIDELMAAAVSTRDIFERTYGYFEARIKIAPTSDGTHTAFWLQNSDRPGDVEIDIMESAYTRNAFNHALIWGGYSNGSSAGKDVSLPIHDNEYHTFAVDWDESGYRFYADGNLTWNYTNQEALFHDDEYIILSTGASWSDGNVHTGNLPNEALVDWVRVYELRDIVQIPDNAPPAPTGLHYSRSPYSVHLFWDVPQDQTVTGYKIFMRNAATDPHDVFRIHTENTGPIEAVQRTEGLNQDTENLEKKVFYSYKIEDLDPSTDYEFKIQALHDNTRSKESSQVSVRTKDAPTIVLSDVSKEEAQSKNYTASFEHNLALWSHVIVPSPTCDGKLLFPHSEVAMSSHTVTINNPLRNGKYICFKGYFNERNYYAISQKIEGVVDG